MSGTANPWLDFYLVCFLAGFCLSGLSLLLGSIHFGGHHTGISLADLSAGAHQHSSRINFGTAAAFLMWLGAAGFLLTRHAHLWSWLTLLLALLSGLFGGALVLIFVTRLLTANERPLRAADYEMVGVIGVVTVPVRVGGTGEIVFSQEGTRHGAGARDHAGGAIGRGTEVVILRFDDGIAYVRPLDDLTSRLSSEIDNQSRGRSR